MQHRTPWRKQEKKKIKKNEGTDDCQGLKQLFIVKRPGEFGM